MTSRPAFAAYWEGELKPSEHTWRHRGGATVRGEAARHDSFRISLHSRWSRLGLTASGLARLPGSDPVCPHVHIAVPRGRASARRRNPPPILPLAPRSPLEQISIPATRSLGFSISCPEGMPRRRVERAVVILFVAAILEAAAAIVWFIVGQGG
jgi:hypothetical protein